jgi:ATP-dependent Zn protease
LEDQAVHSDEELAWHEAGHTVVYILNGYYISLVTIESSGEKSAARTSIGYDHGDSLQDGMDRIRESTRGVMAGAAVYTIQAAKDDGDDEIVYYYDEIRDALGKWEDSTDWERVTMKIDLMLELQGKGAPEKWDPNAYSPFDGLLEEIFEETVEILQAHWPTVEAIATALLEKRTLTNRQVGDIWEAMEGPVA